MIKIGITGGIGCGKSTVCRLFQERGIAVYDSDAEAKRLMTENELLREAIKAYFGEEIYREGSLDRKALAARVFSDGEALAALNALVHPAVMRDFGQWAERQQGDYVVLESAILFEAGLEGHVDHTIAVMAPLELRIERAAQRDGCDREAIRRRIAVQMSDDEVASRADYVLVNILREELAPEVDHLDRAFRHEAEVERQKRGKCLPHEEVN